MDGTMTTTPEQDDRIQMQFQPYLDLIDGGVFFVLSDGTEQIAAANKMAASLYECEGAEDLLRFCSSNYRNLMEEEDYEPLSEIAREHPEHFPLAFHYKTKAGHFRKVEGVGSLKETP